MKYVLVLGDGMADEGVPALGGLSPLEYAETPVMDSLAAKGEIGIVHTIPKGMKPGSDTANLSVLGYDPAAYYSGRSPLEALSIGVPMKDTDISYRVNIVTLNDAEPFEEKTILDHSSSEISTEDSTVLLRAAIGKMQETLPCALGGDATDGEFQFYPGTSYRHCMIWDKGESVDLSQPHDHLGQVIGPFLPPEPFLGMMKASHEILKDHPLNQERIRNGLNPANCFWFWGAGTKPQLSPFEEQFGKKGVMISAVDLLKGIGVGSGMKVLNVPGATGGLETNYEGKAQAAVDALLKDGFDFAYIHVEAPDEMGHQGSPEKKVKSIEYLDGRVIRIVKEALDASGEDYRLLVLPDHPTPVRVRTHTADPVPYLLYDSTREENHSWKYNEREAAESGNDVGQGPNMIRHLFGEL